MADVDARARAEIQQGLDELSSSLEMHISHNAHVLRAMESMLSLDPNMSKAQFARIAEAFFADHSELKSVAVAPDLVVDRVYPLEGNEAVLGLDYRKRPDQLDAVQRATEAAGVVVAGPVNLVQGGRGLILRSGIRVSDPAELGLQLWGVISLVLDVDEIFEEAGVADAPFRLAIRGRDASGPMGDVFVGQPHTFAEMPVTRKIELPVGSWFAAATPSAGWIPPAGMLMQLRLSFVVGGLVLLAVIWTALRLVQLRIRAIAQLTNAINSIDDGFALYDPDDRMIICNDKYKELYAVSADLFVPGAKFEDIIRIGIERGQYSEAEGREEEFLAERLQDHKAANRVVEQKLDNGRWLKIAESRTPDGSTVGFRVDITELKTAKETAERANQAKSEFLDVMSHELRTPLTVVLGGTPFLCKPELLPAANKLFATLEAKGEEGAVIKEDVDALLVSLKSLAGKVERSAKHLLTLINDVLDFSKIEAGRMDMSIDTLDVAELVEDLIEDFSQKAESKSLTLEADVPSQLIAVDEVRLRQVFINIIGNALKFTDTGGLRITTADVGAFLRISVTDTGCGIPEDRLESVFEKFTQVDSSSRRKAGGTGLGMAISKKIVELHGGQISAKSRLNEGSTFSFTVPKASAETDAAQPKTANAAG
ncbi:ATP-binding protein [Cognatishimia sp. 1_MG-2023]|uniref:ATP-binding protein n=1 Tax=Cognatishimia sp. 1_MG-2023 TaxID=3062642 RepID=UPI0026E1A4D9|nr:ATP-binding protein [Cognatishimia sp. 1_MG-2023]MDO6726815.1 ATP-binding protein [Cognatishimia sp. 1_MG-2023]